MGSEPRLCVHRHSDSRGHPSVSPTNCPWIQFSDDFLVESAVTPSLSEQFSGSPQLCPHPLLHLMDGRGVCGNDRGAPETGVKCCCPFFLGLSGSFLWLLRLNGEKLGAPQASSWQDLERNPFHILLELSGESWSLFS